MRRFWAMAMLFLLMSCGGGASSPHLVSGRGLAKTMPDTDALRRIIMIYPYTHEQIDVVYYHDGAYDQRALAQINILMRDRHDNVAGAIDPELIDYMVDIRKRLGLPPTVPFQILSGYRTAATNARLAVSNANVAKESLHLHGWAVDFRIDNVNGRAMCEIAKTMQRGGVAFYPEDNHIHIDLGNIRTWHGS